MDKAHKGSTRDTFKKRGLKETRNVRGFMHQLNEISLTFIDFSTQAPGLIVDMGAAFGVATIPILEKHIEVIACDIEQAHLDEIKKHVDPKLLPHLKLLCGSFPRNTDFDEGSVGSILLSHILHFLSPDEMDLAIEKLSQWLAPNGKVFIAGYTPYISVMKAFIPLYEERVSEGIKWPYCLENNIRNYFDGSKMVSEHLPATMNYLDIAQITPALESAGFIIEKSEYMDLEKNNIPVGIRLDGREWCGVIARKG